MTATIASGVSFAGRARRLLRDVNAWDHRLNDLSDNDLQRRSNALRYHAMSGEPCLRLLSEAFALVRHAASRTVGMRHFDVQILGGIAMCQRGLAEMQTGEGKTLTASLPLYLFGLAGKGAHLATVNDYLARRDAELMRPVYRLLGLSVGVIEAESNSQARRAAYACDITYGTAKEFGFDYLRDSLLERHLAETNYDRLGRLTGETALAPTESPVGREAHFALVDEADSILIDDAGTPLIISSIPKDAMLATERFKFAATLVQRLKPGVHFAVKQRKQRIELNADGRQAVRALKLPGILRQVGITTLYRDIERALRVAYFYHRDRQYVVRDGEICIVDEFTGRIAEGRKWRDGIHQAVEAKEGIEITGGSGQAARITVQDLFLRYKHLAGMSGTAITSARELRRIFRLKVSCIPTNRPPIRRRLPQRLLRNSGERWSAIVEEVREMHALGRPVLVGTRSIDKSMELSELLAEVGIAHEVLNAHQIAREADIVAQAGHLRRVTVATNMAGRGTDIKLGPGVAQIGGMHVICTELHDSARIDRQLIGRCGRQGDPGTYRQYLTADDDILVRGLDDKIVARARTAFERGKRSSQLSRFFQKAQRAVEHRAFIQRQDLLRNEKQRKEACEQMGLDPHLDAST